MERRQENLLTQLENEGMNIAKYRKQLSDLKCSDRTIQYSQIENITSQLNTHLDSFDEIHRKLVEIESVI